MFVPIGSFPTRQTALVAAFALLFVPGPAEAQSPAPACKKALADATARWPRRNRASDGIMGDEAHKKTKSDHNDGNAFDLTHDPANGVDCNVLSRQVINDRRVTYVIWNRQIFDRRRPGEGWKKYTGSNPAHEPPARLDQAGPAQRPVALARPGG